MTQLKESMWGLIKIIKYSKHGKASIPCKFVYDKA